jgi:hypothetical protein
MIMKAATLRTAFALLDTQMDEVTIYPDESGWRMRSASRDHVTLVDLCIGKGAFTDYEVWESFGIATKDILDALSTAGPEVDIQLKDRLILKSEGMRYRKALLPVEENMVRLPTPKLTTEVILSSDKLIRLVSKGDVKYGQMMFTVTPDMFIASIDEEQGLGVSLEIPADECTLLLGGARAAYPVGAWGPFLKALPKGTLLDMQFDDDYPLMAKASFDGLDVTWLVAPHLVEDD